MEGTPENTTEITKTQAESRITTTLGDKIKGFFGLKAATPEPPPSPSYNDGTFQQSVQQEQGDQNNKPEKTEALHHKPTSEVLSEIHNKIKKNTASFFNSITDWRKDRGQNFPTREHRQKIETGEELRDFMAKIRGNIIDKAASSGKTLPVSVGIGLAGGVLRHQALEAGIEVAQAAPLAAFGVSLARDTFRLFTSNGEAIAALSAKYTADKPVQLKQVEEGQQIGFKEKAVGVAAKVGWWGQLVERTAVKAITKKELEEVSISKYVLEFIDEKVKSVEESGKNAQEYLNNKDKLKIDLVEWLDQDVDFSYDKTEKLIETFGFLTDAKTLNNYRDIEGLDNLADNKIQNLETLRNSLHDIILDDLSDLKDKERLSFNGYVDQLTKYKWGYLRKAKYAGVIMVVGAGMAAVKAFAGVKAVDLFTHFGGVVAESGVLEQAAENIQQFGHKSQEAIGDFGGKVEEGIKSATDEANRISNEAAAYLSEDKHGETLQELGQKTQVAVKKHGEWVGEKVDRLTGEVNRRVNDFSDQFNADASANATASFGRESVEVPKIDSAAEAVEPAVNIPLESATVEDLSNNTADFFERFTQEGQAAWSNGANAGEYVAKTIDTGDLNDTWMHGDIEIPKAGAFRNFFGHFISEGGVIDEETALKMGEQLRDSLLVDQEDFMAMARLISEPIANANSPMELENILNSMDKQDALKAAYFIYAQGLIKNPDSRQIIVDFIKGNT
jgi:hypothetical protein